MSVFGGDSWGREAQYQKLPSGKYACLVCPHNPVLDTPLMLSMHMKARRHLNEETKLKQREEDRQIVMNKRIALSLDSTSMTKNGNPSNAFTKQTDLASKPLTEKTRKVTFEILNSSRSEQRTGNESQTSAPYDLTNLNVVQVDVYGKDVVQIPVDYSERREKELKFTAAGWKRDCHGRWFRDENVEFDSDEEDLNVVFEIRD